MQATETEQTINPREKLIEAIMEADDQFNYIEKEWKYGSAGFRAHGDDLDQVCFRMGLLVALKAMFKGRMGVMVTASHNPKDDNGLKIIEGDGSVFDTTQEEFAEQLVNAKKEDFAGAFLEEFDELLKDEKNKDPTFQGIEHLMKDAKVCLGMDTRVSSPRLLAAVQSACDLL